MAEEATDEKAQRSNDASERKRSEAEFAIASRRPQSLPAKAKRRQSEEQTKLNKTNYAYLAQLVRASDC